MDTSLNASNETPMKKKCGEDMDSTAEPSVVTWDPCGHIPVLAVEAKPIINLLLSNELMAIILGKLDLKCQLSAAKVCTQWRQHITALFDIKTEIVIDSEEEMCDCLWGPNGRVLPKHIQHIVLSDFVPQTALKKAKLEAIAQLVAKYGRIHSLSISTVGLNAGLVEAMCRTPNDRMQNIRVLSCHLRITASEALLLTQNCPNLETLRIDTINEVGISESAVGLLLKGLPALKCFTLKAGVWHQYTGRVFEHMNAGIKSINTTGNLLNATAISRLADKRVDQLRELIVTRFDPNCMPLIGTHFTSLRVLSIDLFKDILEEIPLEPLFASISRLVHLEELSVLLSPPPSETIPYPDNSAIDWLRECPKLHSLTLRRAVVAEDFMSAVADNIPALRELNLQIVYFNTEDMIPCLAPIERLRHLSSLAILGNDELTDTVFEALIVNCLQITEINVSGAMSLLTTDSMVTCVRVCEQQPNRSLTAVFSADLKTPFDALNEKIPKNLILKY